MNNTSNLYPGLRMSAVVWLIFYTALICFSLNHIFFWDTVQLASKQAHFFYENGMAQILIPDGIDSGHPPLFGWVLAAFWKLLGKSLWVSHIMMLPVVWLMVIYVHKVSAHFMGPATGLWATALILADPTLMAQASLVSPDVWLMAGFFVTVQGLLSKKWIEVLLGALLTGLVSMRGAMVVMALMIWQFYTVYNQQIAWKEKIKSVIPLLPALVLFTFFLGWHYIHKGWIGYHTASPWAPSFEKADGLTLLRNAAVLCWRLFDFGRWPIWILLLFATYKVLAKGQTDAVQKKTTILLLCLAILLLPSMLLHKGLSGHRYLLPIIVVANWWVSVWMVRAVSPSVYRYIFMVLYLSLATGHLWIYPRGIAQGWDSSMAHWPYFQLRTEVDAFMIEQSIQKEEVGCLFPNLAEQRFLDLTSSGAKHAAKDLARNPYFLYSNIYNDCNSEDYLILHRHYAPIWSKDKYGVEMILYERK